MTSLLVFGFSFYYILNLEQTENHICEYITMIVFIISASKAVMDLLILMFPVPFYFLMVIVQREESAESLF